tara:strand:+ start:3616 stop:3921 length:306 start_codon:yes stop_codon:yes gene_type:complete
MKKLILILFFFIFFNETSFAVTFNQAKSSVLKARTCYQSLPSNMRSGLSKSYYDAINNLSDGRKYLNMKGYERLASSYFNNAKLYADLVLRVGRNLGSRSC